MSPRIRTAIVHVALAVLVVSSFAVRAYYVLHSEQAGVVYDALGYDMSGRRLVIQGDYAFPVLLTSMDEKAPYEGARTYLNIPRNAWTVPGYSVFLSAVYRFSGLGPQRLAAVRLVQSLLGALTVLLAFLLARRFAGRGAGLLAAALVAAYPPYVAAAGFIYTEVLFTFLLAVFLLVMLAAIEKRSLAWWVGTGVLFAVTAYIRPIVLLWYAAIAAYLVLSPRYPKREAIRHAAVLLAVVVVLFVPWWVRNYGIYHRFIPLTTASANPLYAGTTHTYERGGRPTEIYPEDLKQAVATGKSDETVLNDFWQKEGSRRFMERVRTRPLWLLQFRWHKLVEQTTHWWPTSIPFIDNRPWLTDLQTRVHFLLWWLVPVGALAGLKDRRILLVLTLVPYFLVMHALTLPQARYMHPMMLLAAVAGASGVVLVARTARRLMPSRDAGDEVAREVA